jgi:cation transport ATPase
MEFSVRHSMPGRLRLNIPAICHKRSLAEAFLSWISGQPGIKTARINYDCASLVLEYDPAHEPMLRTLLDRFRDTSLTELKLLAASVRAAAAPANANPAPPAVSKRSPLTLPTISLLMAFSANPVVVGLNMPLMLYNAWPIAKRAWKVWSNESRLNIDVLDTLAITSSVLQGVPMAGCIVT